MLPTASSLAVHRELRISGATDIGSKRDQNQDTFVIIDLATGRSRRRIDLSADTPGVLLMVCDGMGGPPAGDVAARLAAVAIEQGLLAAGAQCAREPRATLKRALQVANEAIFSEANAHPEEQGMGTTCTAALCSPEVLSIAQVGDSRAYLFRERKLYRLTRDQTIASRLIDEGALDPSQVDTFPLKHVLVQALGTAAEVKPVMTEHDLRENDRLLLCSDGLHGPVDERTIAGILAEAPSADAATRALIEAALSAGGPDNVTVVVAECGPLG